MVFIESAVFTKQVQELLTDENYGQLQAFLAENPEVGAVIQDTGGLRKMRWAVPGGGKSGGVRVIYFHVSAQAQCRMLLIYRKGVKDDLSAAERKALRKLNQDW
jgi:hypothetical protein